MPEDAPAPEGEETQPTTDERPQEDGTPAPEAEEASSFDPEKYVEKQRYDDLRSEFDRRNPGYALVDALQDPETRDQTFRQIAEELGYELEELEEELAEEERPERDPALAELLEEWNADKQERYLDDLEGYVEGEVERLAKAANLDLLDDEVDLIFGALTPGDDGNPDVEKAFAKVTGLRQATIKGYTSGKRKAPQVPSGSSPSHQPDLDDRKQRREYIARRLQEGG